MDTDPKFERMDDTAKDAGKLLPKPTKARIQSLLKQGIAPVQTAKMTAVSAETVRDIRKNMEDAGQLDALAFKRRTAARLASFIDKSVTRLDSEVESIPIGQLMLSAAIAIDKLDKLIDPSPTVNVKAELRISADDINKLLDINKMTIDVTDSAKPKSE